ncbi:MAG: hypothetical protein WCR79_00205 [Fusobacterium sp.]
MEKDIDFKNVVEKTTFKFIPVINLKNNLIYGYKIIKDFSDAGFKDNDYIYNCAFKEGLFEFFILKLQEKSYKIAKEKKLLKNKLFYTLRVSHITDPNFFFSSVNNLTSNFGILPENLVYEIKEAKDWGKIDNFLNYLNDDTIFLFKETEENPLNLKVIEYLSPNFLEVSSLKSLNRIKANKNIDSKIIFKVNNKKTIINEELLSKKIDLAYRY